MDTQHPKPEKSDVTVERPRIAASKKKSKYKVGQKVYWDGSGFSGPYLIASIARPGIYTLSLENGDEVKGGVEIEEHALVEAE